MKPLVFALFTLAISGGFGHAHAISSLPHDIDIREIGGNPAACLPSTHGAPFQLQSAYLVESQQTGEEANQWALDLEPNGKPAMLRPGDCVVFGTSITGYSEKRGIKQLEEGKTYTFVLQRGGQFKRWWNPNYIGSFCVNRLPNQQMAYPQYIHHPDGTTTYPPCARRQIGGPPAPDGISPPRIVRPWEQEK